MIAEQKKASEVSPLISLEDLKVFYTAKKGALSLKKEYIKAVNGVSLEIFEGETLGLVGESGCGKSTLGKSIIGLEKITDGKINFNGKPLNYKTNRVSLSKQIQIVFQDPYSTLNPRMTIGKLLKEPLIVHRIVPMKKVNREVERLLELVGLPPGAKNLHPHEFSGGQRQRIGIARALSLNPKLIICDEPVSALDVSIQAQIMNLFKRLRKELGLTYLFIAHGLGAIKYISDRIAVMYEGKIVETGTTKDIFLNPQHDYTKLLLSSYPTPDPRKRKIMNEQEQPINL